MMSFASAALSLVGLTSAFSPNRVPPARLPSFVTMTATTPSQLDPTSLERLQKTERKGGGRRRRANTERLGRTEKGKDRTAEEVQRTGASTAVHAYGEQRMANVEGGPTHAEDCVEVSVLEKPRRRRRAIADSESQLAPNGLPLNRSPSSKNEWTARSPLLASLPFDIVGTVHPHIIARQRSDVGGGLGLFATYGIRRGELVWAERAQAGPQVQPIVRSRAWIESLPDPSRRAYCHFMYKTGQDEYQSLAEFNELPFEDYPNVRTMDVSNYMNHSCEPTCWFVDGGAEYNGVMVASRDILPGEEITYDYCTSEDCDFMPEWDCRCGTESCRGRVTPSDWTIPTLQERYAGHFQTHIASRITQANGSMEGIPLATMNSGDVRKTWWLRCGTQDLRGPPLERLSNNDRSQKVIASLNPKKHELISKAATGERLELLNRQAAALISHHRLALAMSEDLRGSPRVDGVPDEGRTLKLGVPVAKGSLVMLLPPNLLQWEEDVMDFNRCLQISPSTVDGPRLFSASLTENDLDNFICHSCDPNCNIVVGEDLAVGLVANRPIATGESITFDYDTTEDDLRGTRGGFACVCGSSHCRKLVMGRLHSPNPTNLSPPTAVAP